tara:strand:+ start:117 stop:932 length:816 start_codon:yes stop_codon:yes gene_type:complete
MKGHALQESFSKIYVNNDEIKRLAAAGDWAFGSRRDTFEPGHWVPKVHVLHDQVVSTYGTEAAKLALWAMLDEQERQMRAHLGLEFVQHQDRIYLYVTNRNTAKELNARYCKVRKLFYVPRAEADLEKIEPYIGPLAKKAWETSLAERRRKHGEKWEKRTQAALVQFPHIGRNQPGFESRLNNLRSPQTSPKPKGRVSLKRLAEKVAGQLLIIDPDLRFKTDAEIAWRVQMELAYCDLEYSFTSVRDALAQNFGLETAIKKAAEHLYKQST